jgi:hypothetical protein
MSELPFYWRAALNVRRRPVLKRFMRPENWPESAFTGGRRLFRLFAGKFAARPLAVSCNTIGADAPAMQLHQF